MGFMRKFVVWPINISEIIGQKTWNLPYKVCGSHVEHKIYVWYILTEQATARAALHNTFMFPSTSAQPPTLRGA